MTDEKILPTFIVQIPYDKGYESIERELRSLDVVLKELTKEEISVMKGSLLVHKVKDRLEGNKELAKIEKNLLKKLEDLK